MATLIIILLIIVYIYLRPQKQEEPLPITSTILFVGGSGSSNYTKIQDALNNAQAGYTIYVYPGIYYENVKIITSVHLVGEDPRNTVINGRGGTCVLIVANNTTVEGFGIVGGAEGISYIHSNNNTLKRCEIWGNGAGVSVYESSYNIIADSVIDENNLFGIQFKQNSCYNVASNILLVNNSASISLVDSSHNMLFKCGMPRSKGFGIHMANATNNTIANCTIFYALQGIGIYENVCSNTIVGNNISYNLYGIRINTSTSQGNIIYRNTFLNNTNHAFDIGLNYWDTGNEGNYWDDYTGDDTDGDGIGDTPYIIPDGASKDNHPLMSIPFYLP